MAAVLNEPKELVMLDIARLNSSIADILKFKSASGPYVHIFDEPIKELREERDRLENQLGLYHD